MATSLPKSKSTPSFSPFEEADLESHCPVCSEPFAPPVYQCNNGHVLCEDCELQCQVCPICRQPMPCRKIRSLQFEKILITIANTPTPCPKQNMGCGVIVKKKDIDDHLLECAFVSKNLCPQLGIQCNQEYSTSKMDRMIEHFVFDHNLNGTIGETKNDQSSTSKLELVEIFNKSKLDQLTELKLLQPNFIRFDDKIFFVKKHVDETEKIVLIMVCIDATLTTAGKYSAHIQLFPGNAGVSVAFEFKQKEIALLTDQFDTTATTKTTLCKIPFSTIEYYGRSDDETCMDLSLKFRVSILKNTESDKSVGVKSSNVSSFLPSMEFQTPIPNPNSHSSSKINFPNSNSARQKSQSTFDLGASVSGTGDFGEPEHSQSNTNINANSSGHSKNDHHVGSVHKMFRRLFKGKQSKATK